MSLNLQLSMNSVSSDGRSSQMSDRSDSNYMNYTSDGLFPDADISMNMYGNNVTDDMAVSYGAGRNAGRRQKQMNSIMYAGNTQSLPPGLAPGSVARFNMANPSPSGERFLVEHLASFPQEALDGALTPAEALSKLKKISSGGGLWAQKMTMTISPEVLTMANTDTMELIEEYPMEQINLCLIIPNDEIFENLLIFSTKLSHDKVGAIHLFQCRVNQANVINDVINKQRERKAQLVYGMNGGFQSSSSISASSSEADQSSPRQTNETRTEWNLQKRHAVAKAVEAFQTQPSEDVNHNNNNIPNGNLTPMQDAKISRDVQILNKCIEEVENFVVMLKRINEARKQLQNKKGRGSKKKKVENILILQSQPPPDHRIFDVYQKFKHSLNLLGKLQPHIAEPSAPELAHYLFIPLGIIVKVTGIEKTRSVIQPLLTNTSIDLLNNCLDGREYNFWQSLGPNWTLTKNAEPFKDQYFQPYFTVFADGWIPPEIIISPQQEAAVKSTTAVVARMQVSNGNDVVDSASKKKKFQEEHKVLVNKPSGEDKKKLVKMGVVVYDYMAHNNKELTIRAGERVQILDDSRRWWLIRNSCNEQGYVPSTVLEIHNEGESSPRTTADVNGDSPNTPNNVSCLKRFSYHQDQQQIERSSSGHGYDTNQNYVNEDVIGPSVPQPVKSTTPVVISVQLPDGSNGKSDTNKQERQSRQEQEMFQTKHSAKAVSRKISNGFGGGEPATAEVTNGFQPGLYQKSVATIKTQSSPPMVIQEESSDRSSPPHAPAPPPVLSAVIPAPPPIPPQSQQTYASVNRRSSESKTGALHRENSGEDLHNELSNRLSIVQSDRPPSLSHPSIADRNSQLFHVEVAKSPPPDTKGIDAVDVFIPLYKSSTADDVSRWLQKLGFSENTVSQLSGKTALQLFAMQKDELLDSIGREDGLPLFDELQVQTGAKSRHQTMTELQKALVKRVQKRGVQQEMVKSEVTGGKKNTPPAVKSKPVRTVTTSSSASSMSPEPIAVAVTKPTSDSPRVVSDHIQKIKEQKEELEQLKKENPTRVPGTATFTSFASNVNAATPQSKTNL